MSNNSPLLLFNFDAKIVVYTEGSPKILLLLFKIDLKD
jgi:hypothetical protein